MTHTCSFDPTAPMPEGMDYSVCTGEVQEVARCAIRVAELGLTETGWRRVVSSLAVRESTIAAAEACMQDSGLWPWASSGPRLATEQPICAHSMGPEM